MWQNYLKIAFRNIGKQKIFFAINVLGLALGMACCFLVVQYAWHESSYDDFHTHADRLYRVNYQVRFGNEVNSARVFPTLGPKLTDYFPEMEAAARMYPRELSVKVSGTERHFEVEDVYFADSSVTRVFDFDFIQGRAESALNQPFSVVVTEEMAQTLFGRTDVLGEQLKLAEAENFQITGVIRDWPEKSHLPINVLVPYQNMVDVEPVHAQERLKLVLESNKTATHSYTYVLLKENQNVEAVNEKFAQFMNEFGDERFRDKQSLSLFPVSDIHLYSEASSEPVPTANLSMLYLFLGIGGITLLIACINFINLTMAGSLGRAKEVGVRKVMGAQREALISQFLSESMLLSFFAFVLSLLLVRLALPHLNNLTGLALPFAPFLQPGMLLSFIGIFVLAGILAGSYPAFYVSRFQAIHALKGEGGVTNKQSGGLNVRKILITLQFVAAITFISGAIIVFLQLRFLRNQPLGFEEELTLCVPIDSRGNINALFRPGDANLRKKMNTLDEVLLNNANIHAVTQCSHEPGLGAVGRNVWSEQVPQEENFSASVLSVDYDFSETFGLEVVAGREFDLSFGTDHLSSFVVNEAAIPALGWESPEQAVGQSLVLEGKEGQVIGVVRNFHFQSLYNAIEPLLLEVRPGAFSSFGMRLGNANVPETLAFIEEKWSEFFPGKAFEYRFLDQSIDELYQSEERLSGMIGYFSLIAVFIACFGLLGLAALTTRHRFKEIGIRKILGATTSQILHILANDFLKLIGLALLLATPITWYGIQTWMEDFAFRIAFPWWVPILTGVVVLALAFLIITSQTIRAALANPVESLRQE